MTIRELIMELRKIGNHDTVVFLDVGSVVRSIEAIEIQELGTGKSADMVYLRSYKEHGSSRVLSSPRRIVWQ
jgi:hypothetical protein